MTTLGKKRTLVTKERFQLQMLVRDEYVKSGLTDPEFATHAVEVLGILGINEGHVASARKDFDIPSLRDSRRGITSASNEERLLHAERRLQEVVTWLRKNFNYEESK